ncbi:piggyBac transposable element-derived protein 2-like [Pygocentrus nattereri]|uniref:piggyBac transposable element-derived protein 2-like n=1 Tax=Pygocentrus nattereri TaxID=42514 RepID=UPI001890DE02|nr:piggyBac transposable element-derived protein 2-like [Pygocentrus nattereri]
MGNPSPKKQAYRVIEEFPNSSEEDCASGSSDEEWLPVQTGASRKVGSSSDSEGEESGNVAEGVEAEEGDEADEEDKAVEPEGPPSRAQGKKAKEKSVRNIWKAKDNQFEGDLPPFLGESKMNVEGADPIGFFMHLFTQDMINDIVHNTNLYSVQKGKEKLALTSEEFKTFLGINMVMSYVRYPRSRMYWSSETGLRLELIADAMPVNRFEQILSYMHFVDNYSLGPKNADRFVKIRPVLDALKETFQSALDPEEFQSVDEMMIPYKGRLSIKQYVPKKPKPWGIKCGCEQDPLGICTTLNPIKVQLGDEALEHQGIYGTGTCRSNRLHGAQEKLKREKQMKQEGRGSVSGTETNAQNITVTHWLDSSVIHMASSCTGLSPTDVAQRWSKKEKQLLNIQRPFSMKLYNQHMGGVDLMDQCVAMYPHRRRNKRWYIRVFFHFLDVTTVNAWLLYRMSGNEAKDLLHFKASIARALINAGSMKIHTRGRPSATPPRAKRRAVSKAPPLRSSIPLETTGPSSRKQKMQ